MVEYTYLAIIFMIFAVIYFIDLIFRTCLFFPYIILLNRAGISIQPLVISFETTRFNRFFIRRFKSSAVRIWFQIGVYVSLICMIPACVVIWLTFWDSVKSQILPSSVEGLQLHSAIDVQLHSAADVQQLNVPTRTVSTVTASTPMLVPIIPGITMPFSKIVFYIITLFVSVIIHEIGHAIAAARENVAIEGFGIGLYAFIPLAFVRLPHATLSHLLPWQQLRIYCAGIWHNIVLSVFALGIIWASHFMLSLVYVLDEGITVVDLVKDTAIAQAGGLVENDKIFSINDCKVQNLNTWDECLKSLSAKPPQGFCTSEHFIKIAEIRLKNDDACCPNSSHDLCFQHVSSKEHFCLPGRKLIENARTCYLDNDCGDKLCLVPILLGTYNRLLKIERYFNIPVLYLGTFQDLRSVTVSAWIAHFEYVPLWCIEYFTTMLTYIVTFSSGLVIMNVIPCFGFDGSFLIEVLVHYYMSNIIVKYIHRNYFISLVKWLGSFLVFYCVIFGIINYLY